MSDWKKILGGIAPTIATAMGGPMAGAAVKFLSNSLMGHNDATEDEIKDYLVSADPQQLANIKEIDNNFKAKMKELDVDIYKLNVENTKSARSMAEKTTMWPQIILSSIFVVGYFAILILLASGIFVIPEQIKDTLILLLGVMTREMPTIMQFWFGSSFGSKKKTEKYEVK